MQYSGEGVNFMTVEINQEEIITAVEGLCSLQGGSRSGKQASQVGGLSPAHFDLVLKQVRQGCLNFVTQLCQALPTESFPYLPRINALITRLHQGNLKSL